MAIFRRKNKTAQVAAPLEQKQQSEPTTPPPSDQLTTSLAKHTKPMVYAPRPTYNNYFSSDSGYGSAVPSRTPSENDDCETITALPALPGVRLNEPLSIPQTDSMAEDNALAAVSTTDSVSSKGKGRVIDVHISEPNTSAGPAPPTSVLEGFKVNKRGVVLDEEGDILGELIDGEILDCVRQKVNDQGEVLDEQGRVVGHVRTVPKGDYQPALSRPTLSVLPAAGQAQDSEWVPAPFSYRGDVSASSHLSPSPSQHSFHGMAPLHSNQRPTFASRHTSAAPSRKSPAGSYDPSPSNSDDGRASFPRRPSAGGHTFKSDFSQAMISGPSSRDSSMYHHHRSYTNASAATMPANFATTATINRPRTYFTHKGRITIMPGEEYPTSPTAEATAEMETSAEPEKKKKRRFGFGKKK